MFSKLTRHHTTQNNPETNENRINTTQPGSSQAHYTHLYELLNLWCIIPCELNILLPIHTSSAFIVLQFENG